MRKAISDVPDGVYEASIDADGFDEDETHIACAITVSGERDHRLFRYVQTDSARLNCVMNYTDAYSVYPVKCALDPTHKE